MKRLAIAYLAGIASPLVLCLWLGGETVAQAGFRLAAIESGFSLASRHWQFEAVPEHESEPVVIAEAPAPKTKGRKRP